MIAGFLLFTGISFAARPTYEASLAFGRALEVDYANRRGQAFVERLDGEALRRATFEVFGPEAMESTAFQKLWRDVLLPPVEVELRVFDQLPTLTLGRVMLLQGKRALECILTNPQGNFQMWIFRLEASSDGKIYIADLQRLGPALETSRRVRHLFLLLGAPFTNGLSEEERNLRYYGEEFRDLISRALEALGRGEVEEAYRRWSGLSGEMKATRIWSDLRDNMAGAGSKQAQADMLKTYERHALTNSLVSLDLAAQRNDRVAMQAALDAMLKTYHHPPFLLAVKAGSLVEAGAPAAGYALARKTYELNPFTGGAYIVAVQAACALGKAGDALEVVRDWQMVAAVEGIERALGDKKIFGVLTKSPAYEAWLRQAKAGGQGQMPRVSSPVPAEAR